MRAQSWAYGDAIIIYRDGVQWFTGTLGPETRSADGGSHIVAWTVYGPWQGLEEITYIQDWGTTRADNSFPPVGLVSTVQRGDVVLMQRLVRGEVVTIRTVEQVKDILDFAATRTGASPTFTVHPDIGTTFPGIYVDFVKATDETCANLVRRLSKWHPLATSWFDYTTTPPTLHFAEPAIVPDTVTIDRDNRDDPQQVAISMRSDADLQVPYVKIIYKKVNQLSLEGQTIDYIDITEDVAGTVPAASGGDHRRALIATVDLAGATASVQVQRVRTRTLPESDDGVNIKPQLQDERGRGVRNKEDFKFDGAWKDSVRKFMAQDDRLPWLKDIVPTGNYDDSNIGVLSFRVEKATKDDDDDSDVNPFPAGEEEPVYELWETPRILDKGSTVADWMDVKTQRVKVTCKLIFKGASRKGRNVRQYFTGTYGNFPMVEAKMVLTATDAVSKSYQNTTAGAAGEDPPSGIAQKLYSDLSVLRHTGTVTLENDDLEAGGTYRPGKFLNITNSSNAAWTAMNVLVQSVRESVKFGRTTISVGMPDQLGLNDFITLARLWRNNPPSYTTEDQRKKGNAGGSGNSNAGGEDGPKDTIVPILQEPRDPFVVTLSPPILTPAPPNAVQADYKIHVEPGYVTVDRDTDGLTHQVPIMPTIGGIALDNDPRPSISMAAGLTRLVYAKHIFNVSGRLTSVEILADAAALPDELGKLASPEYRKLAEVDTTVAPATVEQFVEGSYYHPNKFEVTNGVPANGYTPPFHPIPNGGFTRFQTGYVVG
ncbi:MAG TPA: hypothetical protein VMY39_04355, partial [Planctomycetota bacterium]|nr:hypothetical protein [Planctomycetota bacterium]